MLTEAAIVDYEFVSSIEIPEFTANLSVLIGVDCMFDKGCPVCRGWLMFV